MHIYQGGGLEGSTIVGFGLVLNVTDDNVTVEYNGHSADYHEVLRDGRIPSLRGDIELDAEQLAWLEDSKTWVKHQIKDSQ